MHEHKTDFPDEVLHSPRLLNLPLLLLANKQDKDTSLTVAEVREGFDAWQRARPQRLQAESSASGSSQQPEDTTGLRADELSDAQRAERMASLDVLGVSALEG